MLEDRFISARDVTADASLRLLAWLLERGADAFTVVVMAIHGEAAPVADAFEDALAPFALPPGDAHEMRRWALTPESLAALRPFVADGLFVCTVGPAGWLEDLAVYRRGARVLGVDTHEGEAVLRLTPEEHAEVRALGVASTESGERRDG